MKKLPFLLPLILMFSTPLFAKTLILEGELDGKLLLKQEIAFSVDKPVETLQFRFALPADFSNKGVAQNINAFSVQFEPKPQKIEDETDRFGNGFKKITWKGLKQDARIKVEFEAGIKSSLSAMTSEAAFPLKKAREQEFTRPTSMVQSDEGDIVALSKKLTDGAVTEYQAVNSILNYVADNIKYAYNPEKYDAQYTLANRSGNCQNFAHLSMALLRAAGIPSRIVGGISLKDQWKVPVDSQNSVVQGMGQGGHAWMEIYFPDLGWLSYDPQQSRQFTSTRHIKQTHGLDSTDINDTWSAAPYLPRYSESIDAKFIDDRIEVTLKGSDVEPRPYLLSNSVKYAGIVTQEPPVAIVKIPPPSLPPAVFTAPPPPVVIPPPAVVVPPAPVVVTPPQVVIAPKPVVKPPPPVEEPAKPAVLPPPAAVAPREPLPVTPPQPLVLPAPSPPVIEKPAPLPSPPPQKKPQPPPVVKPKPVKKPDSVKVVEFGNMEFPSLVDTFRVSGMNGTRVFDKETSEYVTSTHVFAQAVIFESDTSLDKISLAMHKFGGDGSLFLDFVADDNGKPSLDGIRSNPVFLDTISRRPGYFWIDFKYSDATSIPQIKKGKYWVVLRHSGDAIVNWFYIPGKPYSKGDDTRSTAKGYMWEDILSYDFVFKVTGRVKGE